MKAPDINDAKRAGKSLDPRWDDEHDDPIPSNVRPIKREEQDTSQEMKPALTEAFEGLHERIERIKRGQRYAGEECGIRVLDDAIDGWQRKNFHVIGGRTGMGKSVVGLNIAMGLARNGFGVDFLTPEMPTAQQALRCLLCASGVPFHKIKYNTMQPSDWAAMTACVGDMCKWPWVWDDKGSVDVEWIAKHVNVTRERLQKKGTDLHSVVIDHVQKIKGKNDRAPRREQMVWIVDGLKQLAKRADVCVIALAQIGRGTEQRNMKDRRPRMADLQEAGAIEQEADVAALLYREDYYAGDDEPKTNVLEVRLAKVRGGEPKTIKLLFDGSRSRIGDLDE